MRATRPAAPAPSGSTETRAAKAAREGHIAEVARIVSGALAFVVGPSTVAMYVLHARLDPAWQFRVLVAGSVAQWACWIGSWIVARRGRFELTGALAHFAVCGQTLLLLGLRDDSFGVGALALVGTSMLIWVLAPRLLVPAGAVSVAIVAGMRVLAGVGVLPLAVPPSLASTIFDAALGATILPIVLGCLKLAARINEVPFRHLEASAGTRLRILGTVARVQPELAGLTDSVSTTANVVASGAKQQAATAEQVAAATARLEQLLVETSTAAKQARAMAETVRQNATQSGEKLAAVEGQLASFLEALRGIVRSVQGFADRSQGTDQVITAVEEVHDAVKILAINAAIEAARAGEAGRGIAVVATEMRSMIAGTEASVRQGRHLLSAVRTEASTTIARTDAAAAELARHVDDLRGARELIGDVVRSFAETAQSIETIAIAGDDQRRQVEVVARAMQELKGSAGELTRSASELLDGTDRLARTQGEMARLVDDGARDSDASGGLRARPVGTNGPMDARRAPA